MDRELGWEGASTGNTRGKGIKLGKTGGLGMGRAEG